MPLDTPGNLDSFYLAGYQFQATAPEEMREGVRAAFRFWFFKKGDPIVQAGRVVPQPITLSFKFQGPDALDMARFLKRMCAQQAMVPLSWAQRFSFNGYLTAFDFTYTQKVVTGTLTYQPIKDRLNQDAGGTLGPTLPGYTAPDLMAELRQALADLADAVANVLDFVSTIQGLISAPFVALNACIGAIQSVVNAVQSAIATFGDILSMPFQVAANLASTCNDALALIPGARTELNVQVLAPTIPMITGTGEYLAVAAGQSIASVLDDLEVNLALTAADVLPTPLTYIVQDGDTLDIVSQDFGVTIGALLAMNPGLTEATLTPGASVLVPFSG